METRSWSLKIIIVGSPTVGKTSMRRAYLGEKFRTNYHATIGADFSFKQIQIGQDKVSCSIWDLAGQKETFANVHPQYYRGSAGALIVYDVTQENSFIAVEDWLDKYKELNGGVQCPILIVGNKIDLIDEYENIITRKQQQDLIVSLKEKYPEFPILSARTSAKTGKAINESFEKLVDRILEWQKERIDDPTDDSHLEIQDYIKSSYLISFHDALGPQIIGKSPQYGDDIDYTDQEFGSAIKISSILDFQDVIDNAQVTGTAPWMEPKGTLYYIAFALDNKKARGEKSLFIIGIVGERSLKEIISRKQHIVDGYLHNHMNEFVRLVKQDDGDLTSQESDANITRKIAQEFTKNLTELREQVFVTIKPDLL